MCQLAAVRTTALAVKPETTALDPLLILAPTSPKEAATAAVCPDLQVLEALQANQVRTANPEPLDFPAHPESRQLPRASQSHRRLASHARKDLPAHPDHQAQLETQDHPEMPASQAPTHHPVNPVQRDPPDLPERLDHQDPLAMPALQQSASRPHRASPARQEMLVHPAQPAHQESQEKTARPDLQAPRAHPDPMDHQVPMDSPDLPARLELLDHRARRVSAPSTALSTAVCSSKTEHDDKDRPATFKVIADSCRQMDAVNNSKNSTNLSSTLCWQRPFRRDSVIVQRLVLFHSY